MSARADQVNYDNAYWIVLSTTGGPLPNGNRFSKVDAEGEAARLARTHDGHVYLTATPAAAFRTQSGSLIRTEFFGEMPF
jgi:hypothetical protein